jgi:hypothetical protein
MRDCGLRHMDAERQLYGYRRPQNKRTILAVTLQSVGFSSTVCTEQDHLWLPNRLIGTGYYITRIFPLCLQSTPTVPMPAVRRPGDIDRAKLRQVKGYDNLIRQTTDTLTLKPVKPATEALYRTALHEWDLYCLRRHRARQHFLIGA